MPEKKLKLYVWEGISSYYGSDVAVAFAENVYEDKRLLIASGTDKDAWEGLLLNGVKHKIVRQPGSWWCEGE